MLTRVLRTAIFVPFVMCCSASAQSDAVKNCEAARSLPFDQAEQQVIEKADVEMPPLAKSMRIQGVVRLEICVSEKGDVVSVKPISGHPLLVPSAIATVKKWRFRPQEAGSFKTVVEIPFSQGSARAEIAAEQETSNQYFAKEDSCRAALRAKKLDDALKSCTAAVEIVERLPKERANERRVAYQLLGSVYFAQRRYDYALRNYRTELEIGLNSLQPYEAELAYAYHDIALTLHLLGRASDAAQNYMKAEQTMAAARDHIGLEGLKPRYSATLKQIREHYLILLKQTGQASLAAELQERIQRDAGK